VEDFVSRTYGICAFVI